MAGQVIKWMPSVSGIATAVLGLAVLAALAANPQTFAAAADSTPSTTVVVTTSAPQIVTTTIPEAIEGLERGLSDALFASGYSHFMTESQLDGSLPPSVVDALIEAGVVVVVPQQGDTNGGG